MDDVIKHIPEDSAEFPACLRLIASRPKQIYLRGTLDLETPIVAVVGSRIPSVYGKQATHDIVSGLARAGVGVVSGMAPGIDTLAHQAALENHGLTIGVIAAGLSQNSFYPRQNLDLARKVVDNGGCLISEYPPEFMPTNYSFPQRNRIIAGLARAVVVVEAKEKSGSLITADWGRKQRKPVFAVPGSIYSANSAGCHWLLKNGGSPATGAQDILDALEILPGPAKTAAALTPEEQKIIDALIDGAKTMDQIIRESNLPAQKIMALISIMEMNNLLRNLGGGEYCLN